MFDIIESSSSLNLNNNNNINNISGYILTEDEIHSHIGDPNWYLYKILYFGTLVTQLESLHPNPITNTIFTSLVFLIREFTLFNTNQILQDPRIKLIQSKVITNCGKGEYLLEEYWAKNIISTNGSIMDFPYYNNYKLLMEFETQSLKNYLTPSIFNKIKTVAFIGSGPLPISSIEILKHLPQGTTIVNYDLCQNAIKLGSSILDSQSKNISSSISFIHSSAQDIQYLNADIVYLAALAGINKTQKRIITQHLYKIMKPYSVLLARSSTELRTFIYHPINKKDFGKFKGFQHFNPTNKNIINSIAIGIKI